MRPKRAAAGTNTPGCRFSSWARPEARVSTARSPDWNIRMRLRAVGLGCVAGHVSLGKRFVHGVRMLQGCHDNAGMQVKRALLADQRKPPNFRPATAPLPHSRATTLIRRSSTMNSSPPKRATPSVSLCGSPVSRQPGAAARHRRCAPGLCSSTPPLSSRLSSSALHDQRVGSQLRGRQARRVRRAGTQASRPAPCGGGVRDHRAGGSRQHHRGYPADPHRRPMDNARLTDTADFPRDWR